MPKTIHTEEILLYANTLSMFTERKRATWFSSIDSSGILEVAVLPDTWGIYEVIEVNSNEYYDCKQQRKIFVYK